MVMAMVVTCPLAPVLALSHHLSVLEEESPGFISVNFQTIAQYIFIETKVLSLHPVQCPV